jgi:hypothetical protein
MRTPLAFLCLALTFPILADDEEPAEDAPAKKEEAKPEEPGMRLFTSRTGKTVKGKVISRIDDETYMLRSPEGQAFKLRLSSLADSDQLFLEKWAPDLPIDLKTLSLAEALPKMGFSTADLIAGAVGPVVTLKIDGTEFKLLVDPKVNNSLIDKEAADNANLELTTSTAAFKDAAGNQVVAEQCENPDITFGDSLPIGGPILVINLEVIGGSRIKNEADGIMGADLLKRANAILDFNNSKLHVRP